eukprot:Selendium_serpulae@DN9665_c0_g1_i1.p1
MDTHRSNASSHRTVPLSDAIGLTGTGTNRLVLDSPRPSDGSTLKTYSFYKASRLPIMTDAKPAVIPNSSYGDEKSGVTQSGVTLTTEAGISIVHRQMRPTMISQNGTVTTVPPPSIYGEGSKRDVSEVPLNSWGGQASGNRLPSSRLASPRGGGDVNVKLTPRASTNRSAPTLQIPVYSFYGGAQPFEIPRVPQTGGGLQYSPPLPWKHQQQQHQQQQQPRNQPQQPYQPQEQPMPPMYSALI